MMPDRVTLNPVAFVRMVVALYMIFAMSDVATAVGILFLLHDIDLELEYEVR